MLLEPSGPDTQEETPGKQTPGKQTPRAGVAGSAALTSG
jgi:hypothetical protein